MKKILLALAISLSLGLQAQDYFWSLTWDVSTPMGDTRNFIDSWSARGIGFDNRWVYNEKYSVGVYLGWQVMYQKLESKTAQINIGENNALVSGNQYRYINSIPLVVNGHYYFNPMDKISVYAGAGAGAYWLEERTEMGLYALVDKGWRFGFYPEIGVHFKINRDTRFIVASKYNYVLGKQDGRNYNYLNLSAGLSWGFF